MARRALSSAQLDVVAAVRSALSMAGANAPAVAPPAVRGVVRLGVSGGADSMAMAAAVAHQVSRMAPGMPSVEALVVDHGLAEGSARLAEHVVEVLRRCGLTAQSCRVDVAGPGGLEDAARRARHEALWKTPTASGAPVDEVWLAHTRDDQAEQVLLGLARGSGVRSLAGMTMRRVHRTSSAGVPERVAGEVVRPLLRVSRATTVAACRDWGIEPWSDPANSDPRFRRSALRVAMPLLADALGVDLTANLCRTADLARDDADLLDRLAGQAASDIVTPQGLLVEPLLHQHAALRSRVVHGWLRSLGSPASRVHVQGVLALALDWHGQGPVDAGNRVRISRRDGLLVRVPDAVTAIT